MSKHLDIIGIPFPKNHPAFENDTPIKKLVFQIESFVEISHDLDDVLGLITAMIKLEENIELSIRLAGGMIGILESSLGQGAIFLYARCFNSATGRAQLNAKNIFIDQDQFDLHKTIDDIRDKFIAHQSSNANKHYLFVLQGKDGHNPILNPNGQTSRLNFNGAIDWLKFIVLVKFTQQHVTLRIQEMCSKVTNLLTQEQIDAINTMNVDQARQSHWNDTRDAALNPLQDRPSAP
jgi:hypothetical protein